MPRRRVTPADAAENEPRATGSPIVQAAERLVARIERLASEVDTLRTENAALRREMREALALFQQASQVAGNGRRTRTTAVDGVSATGGSERHRGPAANGRRRRRTRQPKGRATPASVTGPVIRAVLAKLGPSTASQIAREITAAGTPVSGRAVRFIAERAGAQTFVGDDGQRRYRFTS